MICKKCGHDNIDEAKVCEACGESLVEDNKNQKIKISKEESKKRTQRQKKEAKTETL